MYRLSFGSNRRGFLDRAEETPPFEVCATTVFSYLLSLMNCCVVKLLAPHVRTGRLLKRRRIHRGKCAPGFYLSVFAQAP